VLEVTGLRHGYGHDGGRRVVLDGLSLQVPRGQLVAIVGPSGCGKSTLLRCAGGLIQPSAGTIMVNGKRATEVPEGLAVVFQDYSRSLYPWLRVLDNVAVPLHRVQRQRAARRAIARHALDAVGLADAARQYPWQLSGGMQQRVAIARALACGPVLLLMDEPFGSVDAQTREDLEDLLLRVHRDRGITTLVVTHDIDESVYIGDRVVVLGGTPGRIRADLPVDLPAPRDQITTRQLPGFIQLRTEISRLVRDGAASPGVPAA
jgi:NitT/TauT family transport system ATP-binding protein